MPERAEESVAAEPEAASAGGVAEPARLPRPRAMSMQRLILGYAPGNILPATLAIVSISVFTRLLSAEAFGEYSLAFSVTMVLQAILFYGPTTAVTRFYAKAADAGGTAAFLKTMYGLMLAFGSLAILGWGALSALGHLGWTAWPIPHVARLFVDAVAFPNASLALAIPLLLLRALVATNQTVNRAAGRMLRLNMIECLNAVIGVGAGAALAASGWHNGGAVMAGLVIAAAVCATIDMHLPACLGAAIRIDRALLHEVFGFVWPLVLAWVVLCSLQYADRFLVQTYTGAAGLGIYVVAFSLVDRPITLICMSVTAATFQVAVDSYVREGRQAGRVQAGRNGAVLLGLALPACVGLMLAAPSIAAVLVGPALRDGVAELVPIMAVTALLRGFCAHYVDHAFHLSNRSFRLFAVYLPSAVGNIVLSVLLVPRFGMVGAAYGALACQSAALVSGWLAARRVLPLWLPGREIARIGLCVAGMAVVLLAIPRPPGLLSLVALVAVGVAVYGGCAMAVDLGGLRGTARRLLRRAAPVGAR